MLKFVNISAAMSFLFLNKQKLINWLIQADMHAHIHTYTLIQARIQPHIHADTHTYKHTYKHTYRHTYTHTITHTRTYVHIQAHIYTHKHEIFQCEWKLIQTILWRSQRHIHTDMHAHIHIRTHTSTHTTTHTRRYTRIQTHIQTHIHVHTSTYKHTYTHKHEIFQCERKLILQIKNNIYNKNSVLWPFLVYLSKCIQLNILYMKTNRRKIIFARERHLPGKTCNTIFSLRKI